MQKRSVPTQDEISELPRWAQVAFAARCATRALPSLEAWDKLGRSVEVVRSAIAMSERAGGGEEIHSSVLARHAVDAANVENEAHAAGNHPEAACARSAAYTAIAACHGVLKDDPPIPGATHVAAVAAFLAGLPEEAIREDFERLRKRTRDWDRNAAVSQDVFQ